jgi:branched-subunit amino acid ABC-type transport system permease component
MQQFFQALMSGLAEGAIYASLALALVLIYKATEVINFAQGEMAMFTTYIAYALYTHPHFGHTLSYWPAFFFDARDRLRLRGRAAAGRDPAARARERPHGRDGDDRTARDPQRLGRLDLVA